jgi:molybdopterin/thiamine biosynthesis adenylyltransferase/rhodanese-related sulfurtransferase
MPTYDQLLAAVRSRVAEVDITAARDLIASGAAILDVREQDEVDQGIIPGARHIPRGFLEMRAETELGRRDAPLLVYCAGGVRSLFAADALQQLGWTNVVSLTSGFNGWKTAGERWVTPRRLDADQRRRYSRHLLMPEVGEVGQQKLLDARVLLIGAGGLGSPAGLYLAAAGIGTLGIVDGDIVDESNLQRQVLHTTDRIGMPKVESATIAMKAINPGIEIVPHDIRLDVDNVLDLFAQYDVIVDGTDNFATRYLINDACVILDKPNIHGSVYRFEGQATVFGYAGGPCYRCLFPEAPPPELAPSCAEAGVLGVLPGTVGLLQATETIKVLLGIGESLSGRLLAFDALDMSFREMRVARDPHCPSCGADAPRELRPDVYSAPSCAVPFLAAG